MGKLDTTWTDHKCAVCRKRFSTLYYPEWAYKTGKEGSLKWFCGYKCLREWQKAHERKPDLRVEE